MFYTSVLHSTDISNDFLGTKGFSWGIFVKEVDFRTIWRLIVSVFCLKW